MAQAYCVKCRSKVEIKNKRPATKGTCLKCGTKVFRLEKV